MSAGTTKLSLGRIVAVAAVVTAAVAGCNSHSAQSPSPTSPDEVSPIKVTLFSQPSGTSTLSWDRQSENITAKLQMSGFTPGSSYAVEIHTGSCAAIGDVAVPFPKVTADNAGTISTTLTGERLAPGGLLPGTALSMRLIAGARSGTPPELSAAPLACGNITAAVVTADLDMAPVAQRPQGWADLTYNPRDKTLIVATAASGLAPGSAHAQDVGVGTCEAKRAVKYPLTDLVASANGIAYQTTVIQNVDQAPRSSGEWYLTVHFGSSAQVVQDGQPTPYAAPLICGDTGKLVSTS